MSAGEWSIEHDEHDRQRLRTERELAGCLPSPDYSIELPRHIPLDAFDDVSERSSLQYAFGGRARALDSYRDGEDTHGEGQTVSTAAHHASALTLSAGLAPRFGSPGGEFDGQRPLDDLGIPADMSLFNITRTPRSAGRGDAPRPAVLDAGAQLDRVARSGRFRSHPRETDDAVSDVSTVARRSDADPGPVPQSPRLADALSRQAFSPKRPRAQPLPFIAHQEPVTVMPAMTSTPSYPRPPPAHQQQRIPSGGSKTASTPTARDDSTQDGSRFERMAKGLSTDLAKAKQDVLLAQQQKTRQRAPFNDMGNMPPSATPARPTHRRTQTPARMSVKGSRIHLPDVTGITAAVASPARAGASYYDADEEYSHYDHLAGGMPNAQAVSDAIEELAARLSDLETENGAARRRVRELEHELDACRAEVARERTRVLDAEARERKDRDRMRANAANAASDRVWEARYKEAVEEKKSLENLVAQLRTQLARMTRELESHQAAIHELRTLRDSDAAQMRAKIAEIEELRDEVDRLSDEVERLRDVIEDGLERRREKSMVSHHSQSLVSPPASVDGDAEEDGPDPQGLSAVPEEPTQEMRAEESYRRHGVGGGARPESRRSQIREVSHDNDWFHRTGGATAGSERPPMFIEPEEVSRIETELDERRTERSLRADGTGRFKSFRETHSLPSSRAQSPALTERPLPPPKSASAPPVQGPVPVLSKRQITKMPVEADVTMRGDRLRRMFTNAPEHDEHTCAVCHRRKRTGGAARFHSAPPDIPEQWGAAVDDADDEGFAEAEGVEKDRLPPQTVLARVLRELEDDFTHYKGLYVDLADQYKLMDAASNVVKRNVVAEQLKEVIDTLEQKGDHIAALYDLLKFGDKPLLAENGWATSNGRMRARRP